MNKSVVAAVMAAFLFANGFGWGRSTVYDGGVRESLLCGGFLLKDGVAVQNHFDRIGGLLGNTWDVLGVLRSITIEPCYRVRFLDGAVGNAVGILEEVVRLSTHCELAAGHCKNFLVSFADIAEQFNGVKEAFDAVCMPTCSGEERVIGQLVERARTIFHDCWTRALKIDTASKADE